MNLFKKLEEIIAIVLLFLMGVVVVFGAIEVGYEIVSGILSPPGFFLGVSDLFDIFGLFLIILIGLELMACIHMYLDDHNIHAEMMFLVALTAVTRKIVILDTKDIDPMFLMGIGVLVISLSGGYYLVKKTRVHSSTK